ncbi:MAG TPA: hypothetical protein VND21_12395, partial [Planctomycetota bacterium]|nr:hypothetical protein [Planctomycetota bacterium]
MGVLAVPVLIAAGADGWAAAPARMRRPLAVAVVVAASGWPRGAFPLPPVLPLVDQLPRDGHVILVSDRDLSGPIYTGDRPESHVGGQGIFHRAVLREVGGGRAGVIRLHSVRRPR